MNTTELLDLVTGAVGKSTGLAVETIRGRSQEREIAWARNVGMWLASQFSVSACGRTFRKPTETAIGTYYNRDHSTVYHARRAVQDIIDTEPQALEAVQQLMAKIKAEIQARNPLEEPWNAAGQPRGD